MKPSFGPISAPFVLVLISGALSVLLGASVLLGWHLGNATLVQVTPAFVPMQYNAALGFLLCGAGLLAAEFEKRPLAAVLGGVTALIGALTLGEYVLALDLGIDELLMEHYITVKTSHPGRMAPNTALCFALSGVAVAVVPFAGRWRGALPVSGILGSLVLGLGFVALTGYVTDVETAYGWGSLTRMAVHTALGFIGLGLGAAALAWRLERPEEPDLPNWFPAPVAIAVLTITVALWQAMDARETLVQAKLGDVKHALIADEVMLLFGVFLAGALGLAVNLAQTARRRARAAEQAKVNLEAEIDVRQRAEALLMRAKEESELANRAKSDFLANMSHELRTPLNSILGFSELIASETFGAIGNEKYLEYAKDINTSGVHLLEVVTDILDISKIEAGELEIAEGNIDVGALVASCARMVRERARKSDVILNAETAKGLPGLRADPLRVKQILLNLLSNAIKFTPPGGSVSLSGGCNGDGSVQFVVNDTGIGIAPEDVPKVLKPFGQVRDIMTSMNEGSGLGLSLVKSLTEIHGGRLDIASEPGCGTTVTVLFPPARSLQEFN